MGEVFPMTRKIDRLTIRATSPEVSTTSCRIATPIKTVPMRG